jgi:hypothetical protein
MKFNNVVLYCKGWYKSREGGIKTMWMDIAHCLDADGWTMWNEHEVAEWCLFRLDDLRKDPLFKNKSQLDLSRFIGEVQDNIRRAKWYYDEEISMDTAIILAYRNIISNSEKSCFDSGVKPNRNVLPLHYQEAWYDDGKYSHEPKLYPCEMDCDYQEKVKEHFPDYEDQEIEDGRFEHVEGYLDIKNINDVVVIVGTDSFLDCVEINVTGKQIISGKLNDNDTIDKNIYRHAEIDPDKKYIIRATEEPFVYFEGCEYKIKSMREA